MQRVDKNIRYAPFCLLFPFLLGIIVSRIDALRCGMQAGLSLCANALIPIIFPFLILSELLLSTPAIKRLLFLLGIPLSKILRLSPYGASAFLMGALFGFPIGAKAVVSYYRENLLSKEEGERLLLYSGNASPFFLIGSVGGVMFSCKKVGVYLFLLQLSVSLLCGILLGIGKGAQTYTSPSYSESRKGFSLTKTVRSAVMQCLYICGYVLLFSALLSVILPLVKNRFFSRLLASLLEIGTAASYCAKEADAFALPFCAFAVCFSGFSVFFQTKDVIEDTDLSVKCYLPAKILCGTAAFLFTKLFFCG